VRLTPSATPLCSGTVQADPHSTLAQRNLSLLKQFAATEVTMVSSFGCILTENKRHTLYLLYMEKMTHS
jgi:hypothetical protein